MVTACFYVVQLCLRIWRSNGLYLDSGVHLSCYEPSALITLDMTILDKTLTILSTNQKYHIFTCFIFKHTVR